MKWELQCDRIQNNRISSHCTSSTLQMNFKANATIVEQIRSFESIDAYVSICYSHTKKEAHVRNGNGIGDNNKIKRTINLIAIKMKNNKQQQQQRRRRWYIMLLTVGVVYCLTPVCVGVSLCVCDSHFALPLHFRRRCIHGFFQL